MRRQSNYGLTIADSDRTSAAPLSTRTPLLLDAIEQASVLLLFGWLVARLLAAFLRTGGIENLLLMLSEGLVVLFFLIRRRTTVISRNPGEWMLALGATLTPLLVAPGGAVTVFPQGAATVILMGMLVQLHAKLVLGRSVGLVPAHRGLKLSGPYRFLRHPMYAGYLLTHIGFLALNLTWWNAAVYSLAVTLLVPRLLLEERFLARDPAYRDYSRQVRSRLIPGLF
jgi:protein-S-isoprenylcysteine O-methyltransferase Ste14